MYTIGITGGSGSGKSTLGKLLCDRLSSYKTVLMSADKFYKKDKPQLISPLTGIADSDWNTPEAIDRESMLEQFKLAVTDNENDIVIIEGAFILCYPELRDMLELKIFIDLDSDIRMYRRIKRNMAVRGLTLEEVGDYYTQYAKFSEQKNSLTTKIYADVIFNGINFQNKALDMLVCYIENEQRTLS